MKLYSLQKCCSKLHNYSLPQIVRSLQHILQEIPLELNLLEKCGSKPYNFSLPQIVRSLSNDLFQPIISVRRGQPIPAPQSKPNPFSPFLNVYFPKDDTTAILDTQTMFSKGQLRLTDESDDYFLVWASNKWWKAIILASEGKCISPTFLEFDSCSLTLFMFPSFVRESQVSTGGREGSPRKQTP